MKTKNLFFGALACLAFAACSNDDEPIVNGGAQAEGDQYVVVNIAVPGTATRAEEFNTDKFGGDGKEFVNGTAKENDLTDVTFIFFDATKVTQVSYVDQLQKEDKSSSDPNVEVKAKTVLALDETNPTPSYMMALVNAGDLTSKIAVGTTIDDVLTLLSDIQNTVNGNTYFTMSSSAFNGEKGLTTITDNNLQKYDANKSINSETKLPTTADENKAVNIYVERVAARVDVDADNLTLYAEKSGDTKTNEVSYLVYDEETKKFISKTVKIEPQIQGVHLSYATPISYFVKNEPKTQTLWTVYGTDWTDALNKRSYWAESVAPTSNKWTVNSVETGWILRNWTNTADGNASIATEDDTETTADETKASFYCNENALAINDAKNHADHATKLVITAKLKISTKEGDATEYSEKTNATLVKYMTDLYLYDDFKYVVQNVLDGVYYTSGDLKTNDWTSYISLVRANASSLDKAYCVVPNVTTNHITDSKLFDKESNEISLAKAGSDPEEKYTIAEYIQKLLNDKFTTDIWCWQNGKAYYYVDIEHLGSKVVGEKTVRPAAIVRNHVYSLNLSSIIGLGTPVFWPDTNTDGEPDDQPIDPEKPTDDAFYVTAKLNVLKWRLVGQQDVELEW